MPADGRELQFAGALAQRPASARGSVRSICGRFASFDLLARGCELTDKDFTSLALLLSGLLLLGGRSLSSLQSFFSFSPRISQGCNASRQSSDILSGRCQLMGKDFNLLALLFGGLLVLDGQVWGIGRVLRAALGGTWGASCNK